MKRVEFGYSGSLPSQYRTFAFDPAGNITEKKIAGDSSTVTETRTYNDLNQLTQNVIDDGTTPVTWTYTHDANGNMTSKTDGADTYTYVWNVDNQLEEVKLNTVTLVEYVYDSGSRLIQRTENGTTTNYTWDGWDLVREDKTGAVTSTTKYLVPEGEVLAFERDGEMFYLHGDALSSTQLITDENGDQVARFVYGAWGEELHAVDNVPGGTECRFVGGLGVRTDPVTGLIYMRHRWYSVEEQRFISRDPIGFVGGSNLYIYPKNPVNAADSFGLQEHEPTPSPSPGPPVPPLTGPPEPLSPEGELFMEAVLEINKPLRILTLGLKARSDEGLDDGDALELVPFLKFIKKANNYRKYCKVKNLKSLHSKEVIEKSADFKKVNDLSDTQLLEAVSNPKNKDFLTINKRSGKLMDGNTRAHVLKKRSQSKKSRITPETEVPVRYHDSSL